MDFEEPGAISELLQNLPAVMLQGTMTVSSESVPSRIQELALPKPINKNFIEDRRSVYWTDSPIRFHGKNKITDRQKMLAQPKMSHPAHRSDRPSPIWIVSKGALKSNVSQRVTSLANPKKPHTEWEEDKPVFSIIRPSALKTSPTERVLQLARPKNADSRYIKPSISEYQLDILNQKRIFKRLEADEEPKEWVERLSHSKPTPKGFKKDRPVKWAIHNPTLKAEISTRVDALSKIRRVGKRGDELLNYVIDPYAVSPASMKATATERIAELSTPIQRKMRAKK